MTLLLELKPSQKFLAANTRPNEFDQINFDTFSDQKC